LQQRLIELNRNSELDRGFMGFAFGMMFLLCDTLDGTF
jgi:hypothetical protein